MHRWVLVPLYIAFSAALAIAQTTPKSADLDPSVDPRLSSLENVLKPLSGASEELLTLEAELKQAASDEARIEIQKRIDEERARVREYRENFRDVLGGAEAAEYEGVSKEPRTLQQQFSDLLQPLFSVWRDATHDPRELEELRVSLEAWRDRKHKAEVILDRIDRFSKSVNDPKVSDEFESARKFWEGRLAYASGQIGVIEAQILERQKSEKPFFEAVSDGFGRFFKSRGLNLLYGILTGVLGYFATRYIYGAFRKVSPVHRKGRKNLASRVSDITAVFVSVMVAILGVMIVFYIRGDWLLLTLVIVMLLGAIWAGKESLPPYVEQIRMLLNLGSVREGERVIYEGIPWEVKTISFFSTLRNPKLQGGELRMPIRSLMGMISRDPDQKEPWFPTDTDDWVLLADDTYGKVITQSPEQVVVLRLGGSFKTYATTDFLGQNPENLSHGFRLSCVFGVDYQHQPESTTKVPEVMKDAIHSTLVELVGREALNSIKVELMAAGASSLDYQILADFDGSVASKYQALQRAIQGCCVDTCNANGWIIPFTQITLHQADATTSVES